MKGRGWYSGLMLEGMLSRLGSSAVGRSRSISMLSSLDLSMSNPLVAVAADTDPCINVVKADLKFDLGYALCVLVFICTKGVLALVTVQVLTCV